MKFNGNVKRNVVIAVVVLLVIVVAFYVVRSLINFNENGYGLSPQVGGCADINSNLKLLDNNLKVCIKEVKVMIEAGKEDSMEIETKREECGELDRNLIEAKNTFKSCRATNP